MLGSAADCNGAQLATDARRSKMRTVEASGVPGIPRQGGQAAASIHFSDWGGG